MTKSKQSNFSNYQQNSKEDTLRKLDEALEHLHSAGLPITISSLADEIGKSRQALYAKYIQDYLSKHHLFNAHNSKELDPQAELNSELKLLKVQNEKLSAKVDSLLSRRRELQEENLRLHEKLNELSTKYHRLLGKYQEDMEDKITHI